MPQGEPFTKIHYVWQHVNTRTCHRENRAQNVINQNNSLLNTKVITSGKVSSIVQSRLFITRLAVMRTGHDAVSCGPRISAARWEKGATTNNNAVITVTGLTKFSCLSCTGVSWNNILPNKKCNVEVQLHCWVCCVLWLLVCRRHRGTNQIVFLQRSIL